MTKPTVAVAVRYIPNPGKADESYVTNLTVPDGSTIDDLLTALAGLPQGGPPGVALAGIAGETRRGHVMIIVDGKSSTLKSRVRDGSQVWLVEPFAGG